MLLPLLRLLHTPNREGKGPRSCMLKEHQLEKPQNVGSLLLGATDLVTLEEINNFLNSSIVGQALHPEHRARLHSRAATKSSRREVAKTSGRTWGARGRERTVSWWDAGATGPLIPAMRRHTTELSTEPLYKRFRCVSQRVGCRSRETRQSRPLPSFPQ